MEIIDGAAEDACGKAMFIARGLETLQQVAENDAELAFLAYLLSIALDEARARAASSG